MLKFTTGYGMSPKFLTGYGMRLNFLTGYGIGTPLSGPHQGVLNEALLSI